MPGPSNTTDAVRQYLQNIGRVDLLSQEEELTLARLVQVREKLLLLRQKLQLHPNDVRTSSWHLDSITYGPTYPVDLNDMHHRPHSGSGNPCTP